MTRANTSLLALAAAGAGLYLTQRYLKNRADEYDLHGKCVLITGGSRGLGLVLGREFVRQGARVAICARDAEELERASAQLVRPGQPVLALPCNIGNPDEVNEMVSNVRQHMGRIDILVNNAGTIEVGPLETMTLCDFEDAMRINFYGALHTMLAVIPGMRERGEGRIVNVTSIGGKLAIPHLTPYTASKFALVGLSKAMRAELSKDGIIVTTACPGLMRTGSPRNAIFKGQHRAEYMWFSIGDALPVVSISAESAARRIIAACCRGEAEIVFPLQAKLAALFDALFPEITADLSALINRLLPAPGGIGTGSARGWQSESALSPSILTTLGDQAAQRNNELSGAAAS